MREEVVNLKKDILNEMKKIVAFAEDLLLDDLAQYLEDIEHKQKSTEIAKILPKNLEILPESIALTSPA